MLTNTLAVRAGLAVRVANDAEIDTIVHHYSSSVVLDEGSYPRRRAEPALQHPEGRSLDPSSTNQTATVLQEPRARSDNPWSTVDWQAEFFDIQRSGYPFTASLGTSRRHNAFVRQRLT